MANIPEYRQTINAQVASNGSKQISASMLRRVLSIGADAMESIRLSFSLAKFQGKWNPATNLPALTTTPESNGLWYEVLGPGTSSITGSSETYAKGDRILASDTAWFRIPGGLIPADGTVTPEKTSFMSSENEGAFVIDDENGNIGLFLSVEGILKVLGVEATSLTINGETLSPNDLVKIADYNELLEAVDYVNSEEDFIVQDGAGNIGLKLNSAGLQIAKLLLGTWLQVESDSNLMLGAVDGNGNYGFYITNDSLLGIKTIKANTVIVENLVQPCKYPLSKWRNKSVLWLGTSIPALGQYPEFASTQNGATIKNVAVSSSSIRKAKADGSIAGVGWQTITRALTHTVAEKQSIIDNWATIRTTLTGSPPATLSADEQSLILSCSYENKLLPYLNGTLSMPDLFVIDHGYNDASYGDSDLVFTSVPATRNDKNTFIGACNFIIDLILQYNAHARIMIMGHYENTTVPIVATAQQALANYWEFPFLKTWEKTGWSSQKAPGSVSLWATAPYNLYTAGQNTSVDMDVRRVWCPDGLHPHTDTSGKAQALMGDIAGEFLSRTI